MRYSLFSILLVLAFAQAAAQSTEQQNTVLTTRPDPDGVTTVVTVDIFVSDIISISNVDQSYKVDIYAAATWKDPRLAGPNERKVLLDQIWHPNLNLVNERNLKDLLPRVARVSPGGQVTQTHRMIGDLSARMDLRQFPHDFQKLPIQLVSLDYGPGEIDLQPKTATTQGFGDFSVSGWRLTLGTTEAEPLEIPSTGEKLAQVVFLINAERDVAYYRWTMYLPLILIVLMAWMVFWIDPSLSASQIGLSTAAIFSLIAFRFSMRMSLPAVSYMTRMDLFLMGCTVLVFLALGHGVVTARFAKTNRETTARNWDRWGRWIYLAGLVVLCIFYL